MLLFDSNAQACSNHSLGSANIAVPIVPPAGHRLWPDCHVVLMNDDAIAVGLNRRSDAGYLQRCPSRLMVTGE